MDFIFTMTFSFSSFARSRNVDGDDVYEADDPHCRRNIPSDHRTFDFRLRILPRQADSLWRQVTILAAKVNLLHLIFALLSFSSVCMLNLSGSESYRHPLCDPAPNKNESEIHPEKLRLLYQESSGISSRYDRLILMVCTCC